MFKTHSSKVSTISSMNLTHGNAICYSGYRDGQDPREGIYPTYNEVKEDLLILSSNWRFLRIYDCGPHAELVLDVIRTEMLDFVVMLGVDMAAEVSNPNCPWGAHFSDEVLSENKLKNIDQINKMIKLSKKYNDIVFSVSVGNEASVEWNDHMVPVESLVNYVKINCLDKFIICLLINLQLY